MTTYAFFALVHAEGDLCTGARIACAPTAAAPVLIDGIENLFAVIAFIGLQPEETAGFALHQFQASEDFFQLRGIEIADKTTGQRQVL